MNSYLRFIKIHNLIADTLFNTSSRITLKLKNNCEVEVHRNTISRLLVEKGYKWKIPEFFQKE